MTSLLEGGLRQKIAKGFAGKLCKGQLRREQIVTLDNLGNPLTTQVSTYTIEGIQETLSAYYRAAMSIPETDIGILIILGLGTLASNNITPRMDDKVFIGVPFNQWFQVRRILAIDPANASARCQAFEIPAP